MRFELCWRGPAHRASSLIPWNGSWRSTGLESRRHWFSSWKWNARMAKPHSKPSPLDFCLGRAALRAASSEFSFAWFDCCCRTRCSWLTTQCWWTAAVPGETLGDAEESSVAKRCLLSQSGWALASLFEESRCRGPPVAACLSRCCWWSGLEVSSTHGSSCSLSHSGTPYHTHVGYSL